MMLSKQETLQVSDMSATPYADRRKCDLLLYCVPRELWTYQQQRLPSPTVWVAKRTPWICGRGLVPQQSRMEMDLTEEASQSESESERRWE